MVAEDDEMSKDKEIDKLVALISLSFKKIYKPTNNNLQTSSNTNRANQDNSLRINRGAGYDNQRLGNVGGARETVGTTVVQKSGIQCYNCKEFRHVARECQKPKRAKDAAYHREKMLLCKQEEARIQLNAEQADWRDDTDDESKDQELEAHYITSSCSEEPSKSEETLHKLRTSLTFKPRMNSDQWRISTRTQRSRTGTELLANLCANSGKQCLQGILNGRRKLGVARLVAKGYTQTSGIDYEETFSPVTDIRAIKILIAIAAYYDYEIWQMDVKTAFLNEYLNEEAYMKQPEGFVNPKYPNW
nr:putative zinc finger, CCHC-type [Tanacetum cinerariifolium]